jgi:tRNA-dihydrouridine synthase C
MEGMLDALLRTVLTRVGSYDWCVSEFVRVTDNLLPPRSFRRAAPELGTGSRTVAGTPVRVQLLGSDPVLLAANADRLCALAPAGIDLNFGCPAPTVNRHRGGAVLLDEPELLFSIATEVASAIAGRVPFTAKMRLGVRDPGRAVESAQALAEGGAQMLVVHARTRDDRYRPPAHWPWVARIAEAVRVPVVANGEIWTVADYWRCRAEAGCATVMLGRGALADPFLASRIRQSLRGNEENGASDEDWPLIWPLLQEYWTLVRDNVAHRHAPGRLKQWLNLLRRHYPSAESLFEQVKSLREPPDIDRVLGTPAMPGLPWTRPADSRPLVPLPVL